MKIISGRSNISLAKKIAAKLALQLAKVEITKFSDGEIGVNIRESIAEQIVVIIQSISSPVNEHLVELLMLIGAAKENEASKVIAVIPYFGYSRSNKKFTEGGVIGARLAANMLETAGANQILSLDLHSAQILDFFKIPINNIDLTDLYVSQIEFEDDLIIASPDIGGKSRAVKLAHKSEADLVVINKERMADGRYVMCAMDNTKIKGKNCLIIDDIIDTGQTIEQAAIFLKHSGAKKVSCVVTHGVLSKDALARLEAAPIDDIYLTNSISLNELGPKFKVIDVAEKIAQELQKVL